MQREYVWRPRKVESLLESLYKGWPVGSFYLWRPSRKQPKKNNLNGTAFGDPVKYLLDGQQRLASLSRAIKDAGGDILLPPPGKKRSQAISWRGFFDVNTERFFLKGRNKSIEKRIENDDPALVALSDLILSDDHDRIKQTSNIEAAVLRLVENGYVADKNVVRNKLQRVALMLDTDVLCQEIETSRFARSDSEEVEVAISIFDRLNSGGMP